MLKNIFILFLLTLYLLASCRVALPLMEYVLHYNYIATELCENKDKPELDCCGKCYVKKKIATAEEAENSTKPPSPKERQSIEVFQHLLTSFGIEITQPIYTTHSFFFLVAPRLLIGFASVPAQPPEA
jgi:hypothetical protein